MEGALTRDIRELGNHRDQIKTALMTLGDMRQGSLVERFRRCGKTQCRCARDKAFAHGPSWSLTRAVEGKTVTRIIPAHAVAETRAQITRFKEFRRLSHELLEVHEQICEAKLTEPDADGLAGVEKKRSRNL
jgi:hypothetical protein